jgi:hypothetical protein
VSGQKNGVILTEQVLKHVVGQEMGVFLPGDVL